MDQNTANKIITSVQNDYNAISQHFSHTRMNQWYEIGYIVEQYVQPGQIVLDVGCGNGRVADLVRGIKGRYIGIDLSPNLIGIAKKLRPNDDFRVANMMETGFADDTFDHTLSVASFHHIPSEPLRIRTLMEMSRITKLDGYIIMTNWNLHQWKRTKTRWRFNMQKLAYQHDMDWNDTRIPWYDKEKNLLANRYYHAFTKQEIKKLAKNAGLKVIDQYYEKHGMHVPRRKGFNLISILQHK